MANVITPFVSASATAVKYFATAAAAPSWRQRQKAAQTRNLRRNRRPEVPRPRSAPPRISFAGPRDTPPDGPEASRRISSVRPDSRKKLPRRRNTASVPVIPSQSFYNSLCLFLALPPWMLRPTARDSGGLALLGHITLQLTYFRPKPNQS